jgi:futalosine hydrolase
MSETGRILVVAATDREVVRSAGWRGVRCGVGPVEAAAVTAAALAAERPAALLHVGIAGVRRSRDLPPCTVVIGSESRYCDLSVPAEWAPSVVAAAPALVAAAQRALPEAEVLPIGTTAQVGGSAGCDVEAMEGFGVLRAAQLAGVPALEVRVISNVIEEADRGLWRFDDAFATVGAITPRLVAALAQQVDACGK